VHSGLLVSWWSILEHLACNYEPHNLCLWSGQKCEQLSVAQSSSCKIGHEGTIGALEDLVDAHIPQVAVERVILEIAISSEKLQGIIAHLYDFVDNYDDHATYKRNRGLNDLEAFVGRKAFGHGAVDSQVISLAHE